MKITTTEDTRRAEESVHLVAAIEVEPEQYGHRQKRRWQPTEIVATVRRTRQGDAAWSPWSVSGVTLHGHSLRQDGSAGAVRSDRLWDWGDVPAVVEWLAPYVKRA